MARKKASGHPLTQLLLQWVGPALIMAMIASQVWFLVEVFYRGDYGFRMYWVLGLFTAAAVLVSRISIESGRERSLVFLVPLAIATWFVGTVLAVGGLLWPMVLAAFILLVLWAADRLTWDVTVIDSSRDVSATGLLELARRKLLGGRGRFAGGKSGDGNADSAGESRAGPEAGKPPVPGTDDDLMGESGSGNLLAALLGFGKGRNTPGLWVLWCFGAGLVIFGIGQLFVSRDPAWGYLWVAILFAAFLASALGLMTLTSLLGLERYLIRRGISLPEDLPRRWLTAGLTVAAGIALLTLLVPRPDLSGSLDSAVAWVTSRPRDASRFGWGRDGTRGGDNPTSATTRPASGESSGGRNNLPRQADRGGERSGESGSNAAGQSGAPPGQASSGNRDSGPAGQTGGGNQSGGNQSGGSQSGGSQSGNQSGQKDGRNSSESRSPNSGQSGGSSNDSRGGAESGETGSSREERSDGGDEGDGGNRSSHPSGQRQSTQEERDGDQGGGSDSLREDSDSPLNRETRRSNRPPGSENRRDSAESDPANTRQQQNGRQEDRRQLAESRPSGESWLGKLVAVLGRLLGWLLGAVALAGLAWMFRKELASLMAEILAWLENRFGGRSDRAGTRAPMPERSVRERPQVRFADLSNPFRDGQFRNMSADEVAGESFLALEALAREAGLPRQGDATPHEFAEAVARQASGLAEPARVVADAYSSVAYGGGRLTEKQLERLQRAWELMERHATRMAGAVQPAGV